MASRRKEEENFIGKEISVKENDVAPLFRRFIAVIPMDVLEEMD